MTVNSGVVAFRIAARPDAMWIWPHTINVKGMTLLSRPMARNAAHAASEPGGRKPDATTIIQSAAAAGATRSETIVSGGSC